MWYCSNCGNESPKWIGRCPGCGEWNTMIEERVNVKGSKSATFERDNKAVPLPISQIETRQETRLHMPSEELNRVLGGGLVAG